MSPGSLIFSTSSIFCMQHWKADRVEPWEWSYVLFKRILLARCIAIAWHFITHEALFRHVCTVIISVSMNALFPKNTFFNHINSSIMHLLRIHIYHYWYVWLVPIIMDSSVTMTALNSTTAHNLWKFLKWLWLSLLGGSPPCFNSVSYIPTFSAYYRNLTKNVNSIPKLKQVLNQHPLYIHIYYLPTTGMIVWLVSIIIPQFKPWAHSIPLSHIWTFLL